jgi:hypothetical protein
VSVCTNAVPTFVGAVAGDMARTLHSSDQDETPVLLLLDV